MAIGNISDGDSGLSVRGKLNQIIDFINDNAARVIIDTAANLSASNLTLPAGYFAIESDTLTTFPKFKIHNGTTPYNSLPYSQPNLAKVLSVDSRTGEQAIVSDDTKTSLEVMNGYGYFARYGGGIVSNTFTTSGLASGSPLAGFQYKVAGDQRYYIRVGDTIYISGQTNPGNNNGAHVLDAVLYDVGTDSTYFTSLTFNAYYFNAFTTTIDTSYTLPATEGAIYITDEEADLYTKIGGFFVAESVVMAAKYVQIKAAKTEIAHDILIELNAPSVTKNSVEVATIDDILTRVLTGLSITGSSISATDSVLEAFGKLQNQIAGLLGGALPQGVWNASTNTPALASSVGTTGHYYVVNVAGATTIDGINDWKVGDWIWFVNGVWHKVDNTDAVSSVNGLIGAVSLVSSDIPESGNLYWTNTRFDARFGLKTTDNLTEGSTNKYYTDARAKAAAVANDLTPSTDVAPSKTAVNAALALKKDTFSVWHFAGALSPADDTTYYFNTTISPTVIANNHKMSFGFSCRLTSVIIAFTNNTIAGSTEDNTINFRNITTSTSHPLTNNIKSNASSSAIISQTITGLNISIGASDEFCFEWITPTYVTNPTNTLLRVQAFYEKI